jgi:hypothetical protein
MKRATGRVVFAGFAQFDALVDNFNDVDSAQQVVDKGLRNQTSHVGPRSV